ncbi:zinc finger protein 883-like [Dreissena polymorpha]|uniref:Uncharacterized protein n=1 Tax=Dreissena polymorpha TaxID=45954 RepID=A0A9D4R266_DREPO|nr:zinc finger protein 883-like [Dreissena polymorpha]KAH3851428.1 hypothetical protein DPMN_093910 [Dreissena polymorpha]
MELDEILAELKAEDEDDESYIHTSDEEFDTNVDDIGEMYLSKNLREDYIDPCSLSTNVFRPDMKLSSDINTTANTRYFVKNDTMIDSNVPSTADETVERYKEADETRRNQKVFESVVVDSQSDYVCDFCNTALKDRFCLVQHMETHFGPIINADRGIEAKKKCQGQCCDKTFIHKSNLKRNITNRNKGACSGKESLPCPHCDNVYKCKKYLMNHLKYVKRSTESTFTCSVCKRILSSAHALKGHQRIHLVKDATNKQLPGNTYKCEICYKSFSRLEYLLLHNETHNGTQKYECHECKANFSRETDFKRHLYIHTGEKPFKCNLCPKAFRQPDELGRHKRVHSGKNKCRFCEKAYYRENELWQHELKHEHELGIKSEMQKRQCKVCQRIFSNELNLRNHIELKHAYVTEDVLSSGTKLTYKCSFCGKYITTISNLRKHEQRKHAVQPKVRPNKLQMMHTIVP